ncbi:MAG TPA: HK97 family phage prohead protease [Chloroflexota bacterium]|nr:HK97 family phage prohead protease [Chloroflexota bacterium]
MKKEIRVFRGAQIRAKAGDKPGIEGYAAVFNELSVPLWGFRERIMPGAFARALREDQDVRALMNHDPNLVLGRSKSGTLTMREDAKGLFFSCDLPDTQAARDLHALVSRGDIDQCSFGFNVTKQTWIDEKNADGTMQSIRELNDVDLFDVSAVTYPAYPQTTVDARALWPDGVPEEVRSHSPELRAKTKKVDGVELPASSFAFVGDESETKTWKLPIDFPGDVEKTKRHIRNALSRFSQTKGIPAEEKPKVWKRIVAAAKKHGIKVSEEDSIRAAAAGAGEAVDMDCGCSCDECQDNDCPNCSNEECDDEGCRADGCTMQAEDDNEGGRAAKDADELEALRLRARIAAID